MPNTLVRELIKGTSKDIILQAQNPDGTVPTVFLDTDELVTNLFAGEGQPALLLPATFWADASTATFVVAFNNDDSADLGVAVYKAVTTATRDGRSAAVANWSLSILPNIGTNAALTVYCELSDMLPYFPGLSKIQDEVTDWAGFITQRAAARRWLENVIQEHYRPNAGFGLTTFGNSVTAFGPRRTGSYNKQLQQYLDADKLMVAPPRRVVEITAKYAIGLVCMAQITGSDARSSFYQQRGDYFMQEAINGTLGYIAEVDTNGDGYPEYVISCGTSDALWG